MHHAGCKPIPMPYTAVRWCLSIREAEGWDGTDEAILTPRTVTSHQCIPLLFTTRGDLHKGEHRGHHPGKIPLQKLFGGPFSALWDAPRRLPKYPYSSSSPEPSSRKLF